MSAKPELYEFSNVSDIDINTREFKKKCLSFKLREQIFLPMDLFPKKHAIAGIDQGSKPGSGNPIRACQKNGKIPVT